MNACEQFGELISAMADGELGSKTGSGHEGAADSEHSNDERLLVERHLSQCQACQQRLEWFGQLTELSQTPYHPSGARIPVETHRTPGTTVSTSTSWLRIVMGIAAVVVVAISVSMVIRSTPPTSDSTPTRFDTLQVIYKHTETDQLAKLKNLQLELRALMLEANSAELSKQEKKAFNFKIEQLKNKAIQAGTNQE